MIEFIFEFIVLYLFRYPGAFFLSLFSKRKSYQDFLNADGYLVGTVGLLIIGAFIILLRYFVPV
jgi:hypothetical protein